MNKPSFKSIALGITLLSLGLTACKKEESSNNTTVTPPAKSIYEIAKADTNFSILVAGIDKAGLKTLLSGTGTFTVFAPNNAAFRKLEIGIQEINEITDPEEIEELKSVILFHALGSKVKSTELSNTYVPTAFTVNGNGVSLKIAVNPVKINNAANVVSANIEASNGIVHVVDEVLIPPTVVDIAVNNGSFNSLVSALDKAELVSTLEDGEALTVFAPTDKAFSDINFKLEDFTKEALTPILTGHVLGSQVRSNQIQNNQKVTTLNKDVELTFNTTMGVKFSGGKTTDISVTTADLQATNGVVHVINKVILP
ncbi:MAG: fasciclin domain-containing protein [Bacteroidia bacterium]